MHFGNHEKVVEASIIKGKNLLIKRIYFIIFKKKYTMWLSRTFWIKLIIQRVFPRLFLKKSWLWSCLEKHGCSLRFQRSIHCVENEGWSDIPFSWSPVLHYYAEPNLWRGVSFYAFSFDFYMCMPLLW